MATKKQLLPVLIGFGLCIPLLGLAFFVVQGALTRAGSVAPVDIKVVEITSDSATITWRTDRETQGVVEYGTSPKELVYFAPETGPKTEHRVELTLLRDSTPHYFQVRIGDNVYDNGGIPFTFTTTAFGEEPSPVPTRLPTPESVPDNPQEEPTSTGSRAPTARPDSGSCPATDDCAEIQSLFGKGCSTSDYLKCLRRRDSGAVEGARTTRPTATPTLALPQRVR
jgi:hypothetical protein